MRSKAVSWFLVLCGMALFCGVFASDARAAGSRSPVGTWTVDVFPDPPGPPPFRNLVTLMRGGTLINSDPQGLTCHGVWERAGRREFDSFFQCLDGDFTITVGPPSFLEISRDGQTMKGESTTVVTDAVGNEIVTFVSRTEFTRMVVPE